MDGSLGKADLPERFLRDPISELIPLSNSKDKKIPQRQVDLMQQDSAPEPLRGPTNQTPEREKTVSPLTLCRCMPLLLSSLSFL